MLAVNSDYQIDGKLAAFLVRDSGGKALILIKCSKINQERVGM